ncbi:MAG: hypothetical protein RBU25_09400 [Lentisphaeria bacterium]|jgi:hypothetical protein|nr:hypothetical protein [Lentisphaeria bacterium]
MSENKLNMVDFARDLARRGLREDALLILELLPEPAAIETRDLRARLLAQVGRYAEAEDIWQQIQTECPDHQGAWEGLAVVASLRRNPVRRFRVALALNFCRVAGTCLALVAVLLLALGVFLARQSLAGLAKGQRELAGQIAERKAAVDEALVRLRQDATELAKLQLRNGDTLAELKTELETTRKGLTGTLAASRKETAAAIAELKEQAAAIQGETGKLAAGLKAETDKLAAAQQAAGKRLAEQTTTLAKQQEATNAALAKIADASAGSTSELAKSLAGLSAELTKLKATLDAVAKAGTARDTALTETRTQLLAETEALGKRLETLVAADPTQRLADLTAQYLQLRASLNTQTKRTEELTAQLKTLTESMAAPAQAPPSPAGGN